MSTSLPQQKKLISISEAARVLGVSIDTIRRWDKSGLLHSQRPDGKNRYFSLDELEKHKSHQPLPISEVAKKLGLSPTTLRRLETRGLFKPSRNNAGERVYDKDSVENFLSSDYYLRKKPVKEKIPAPALPETPVESTEKIAVTRNFQLLKRIPEFLAATVIFSLLIAIGITNIQISTVKSSQPSLSPAVLSITETPTPTPSQPPAAFPEIEKVEEAPADGVKPQKKLTIEINDGAETVNIRQNPTTDSKKLGKAKDSDTFEFVSLESGWYGIKLADGSTGFISAKYGEVTEEITN